MNGNPQESLMTPDERTACEQIAAAGESPHSLRAQALLILDTGASQEDAATQSGLTPNQVRYWLGRFRNHRLTIFPEELATAEPQSTSATESVISEVDAAPDEEAEVEETAVVSVKSETKPEKKKDKDKKKAKGKKGKKKSTKKKDNKKKQKATKKAKGKEKKKEKKKGKDKKGKKNKKAGKKKSKK